LRLSYFFQVSFVYFASAIVVHAVFPRISSERRLMGYGLQPACPNVSSRKNGSIVLPTVLELGVQVDRDYCTIKRQNRREPDFQTNDLGLALLGLWLWWVTNILRFCTLQVLTCLLVQVTLVVLSLRTRRPAPCSSLFRFIRSLPRIFICGTVAFNSPPAFLFHSLARCSGARVANAEVYAKPSIL